MRILAIDPGYERIGIAILEKNLVVFSECFKTSSKLSFGERLNNIGQEIAAVIKKWKPGALAIETLYFEKNSKTAMRVAEARGVVVYESAKAGLSVFEYTPLQVKMAVAGWGRADKAQVMKMVGKLIKLPLKKYLDDELDAIAVGLTCLAQERF